MPLSKIKQETFMITIGIELNHVVRNINKQIAKYYIKEYAQDVDLDEVDTDDDVLKHFAKFNSKHEMSTFIYESYPYEIFGCAQTMERGLSIDITNWLTDISNIEDKDIRIMFYSLHEEALTIQSTYFFLSKIGTRVRKVVFPQNVEELWDECDVIITANNEIFEHEVPNGKKVILINRPFNADVKDKAFLNYDKLTDIINDDNFFEVISHE